MAITCEWANPLGRCYEFSSISALREWLEDKNFESGNPNAYIKWLENFFDDGNTITVYGEEWNYVACLELV